MLKQYCLEGILAKESSSKTKDFLLRSDLHHFIAHLTDADVTITKLFYPFTTRGEYRLSGLLRDFP